MTTGVSILVILFVIAMIIGGPLITIAALNTLFSLNIAYTFWTWLSVVWLALAFGGTAAAR